MSLRNLFHGKAARREQEKEKKERRQTLPPPGRAVLSQTRRDVTEWWWWWVKFCPFGDRLGWDKTVSISRQQHTFPRRREHFWEKKTSAKRSLLFVIVSRSNRRRRNDTRQNNKKTMPTETIADERKQDDYRTSPEGDPTRSGDIGGEGSSRSSTQHAAATTTTSTIAVNMTNAAPSPNGNRPPSTTSVHSTGSMTNGQQQQQQHPPRTTAMSRRGGRARSRSPSSMTMNRPPSTTPSEGSQHQPQHQPQQQQGGGQSSSTQGGPPSSSNPPPPMSPANPSAAAAAAAAAAKSLHRNNGHETGMRGPSSNSSHYPPSSFYSTASGGPPPPDDRSRYGRGHPSQHHHHHHQYSSHHSRYGASGGGGPPPPPHLRAAPGYYDPYSHGGPPPPTHHHQHPHHRGSSSSSGGWPTSSSGAAGPPTSKAPLGGSSSSGSAVRQRDDPYGYNMYGARGGPPTGTGASSRDPYYHHRYVGNGTGPDDRGEYSRRGPPPPHYSSSSTHHPHYSRGGGPPPGIRPPGSGRSTSPHPPPSSYRQGTGNQDPYGYTGQSKDSPSNKNDPSAKSTKTVIGTATPIHVPRASERPSSQPPSAGSRRASAASVFRGRPGSDLLRSKHSSNSASRGGGDDDDDDESSPQKILMALRTPSHSFEEKKSGQADDSNTSPEDPPQLRSNTASNNLFFDPQRSPKSDMSGPPQPTNSLDMAPSFSLFNQSFDSLGDTAHFFNVGGPLDSALQSASFGGTASILEDKMGIGDLQLTASNGTFKLNASSSGGAMTFGMSPTNSFGNGPTSSFTTRGGNITLLGNDHRAASPSQVLEIGFQSGTTSPHSKRGGSMDEGNLPLSASMGSPTYSRQYVSDRGQGHYQHSSSSSHHPFGHPYQGASYPTHRPYRGSTTPAPDGAPHFYIFLRKHKEAFREVTFLLPGLKCVMGSSKSNKKEDKDETPKRQGRDRSAPSEPNEQEIEISQRRIASAVCAFGGTYIGSRMKPENAPKKAATQSIFRAKSDSPQSSDGPKVSRQRAKYDDALPGRYYENDNRLSWEFEENPPIGNFDDDDDDDEYDSNGNRKTGDGSKHGGSSNNKNKLDGENDDDDDDDDDDGSGEENEDGTKRDKDKPKMRYRCKLCGQPKQNHTCPYQQSLARSIGIMVYPAVNAFTSAEPGVLAPALSEMNNFVGSGGDSVSSGEGSPSRPTPDRMRRLNPSGSIVGGPSTAQVTPESMRGTPRSPGNFLTPQRIGGRTPSIGRRSGSSIPSSARSKKRSHGQMHGGSVGGEVGTQDDLLFVEPMDLKPEQFRMVTPSKALTHNDAFTYPALPLPYAQRKRLSDNLFSLSKEVPQLTDECAAVLREARERDLWDLAVAELMTQVVVVVHCHDGDMCFEGLRRYLLSLGISC